MSLQQANFSDKMESFLQGQSPYRLVFAGFLIVLFAVLYVIPAIYLPLFDMDEGAYAAVSREMALTGQWWATMLNGEPFFHKPVLMYWLQALGLGLVGDGSFAYRLPSLVAFVLWLILTFKFVNKHIDHRTAWLTVWIGLFSAGIAVIFKAAIPDAWLILFISLAMYRSLDFLVSQQKTDLYWAFIWTGFGMLAKGPIALVVVAGTLFIYLVLNRNWSQLKTMILAWKGWLLLLLVALPWYVLQVVLFGQAFINEFFGVHNVGRFMNPMEGHSGNPLYYVVALFVLTLPFFPVLVKSIKPWWQEAKFGEKRGEKHHRLLQVLGIWFLLVLLFFTLAATKLPHYLMYGIPPVIIAMAYFAGKQTFKWGMGLTLLVIACLLASVPWMVEMAMANEKNPYLVETYGHAVSLVTADYFVWLALLAMVGLALCLVKFGKLTQLVVAGFAMTLTLNYGVLHYAATLQQQPIVDAAEYAKHHQLQVVTCCIEMPSFNVVAQQMTPVRMPKQGEVVFGKSYELAQRFKQVEWLWKGRGVALARVIEE